MKEQSGNTTSIIEFVQRDLAQQTDERPLYLKISGALSDAVETGNCGTNKVLPSERALAANLGVSRVTIRRALDDMAASGLLKRRRGARSSVTSRVEKTLSTLTGFSEELRARGATPGQKWLKKQIARPTPTETLALGLSPNDRVVRLTRIRFADDVPIAFEKAVVPQTFLNDPDLVEESLYKALRTAGYSPVRGVQRIRAGIMNQHEADALDSRFGNPLLVVERCCYLLDDRAVEFTETRYHGERYDFIAELSDDQFR